MHVITMWSCRHELRLSQCTCNDVQSSSGNKCEEIPVHGQVLSKHAKQLSNIHDGISPLHLLMAIDAHGDILNYMNELNMSKLPANAFLPESLWYVCRKWTRNLVEQQVAASTH